MSTISVMIFMFLCFLGILVMFLYILRQQEYMLKTLKQELLQSRAQTQMLEKRLVVFMEREEEPLSAASSAHSVQELFSEPIDLNVRVDTQNAVDLELYMEPPVKR